MAGRPDLHVRFLAVVQRGLERAEREAREAEVVRAQGRVLFRPRATR